MILTRVPVGGGARPTPEDSVVETDAEDARSRLVALYAPPRRRWLRLNLVISVDGSVVGADGGSDSLTDPVDRMLMGVIRTSADVVLIGASSVRREGLHVPRRATLAIVTTTGDLGDLTVPEGLGAGRVVVVGPEDAAAEATRRYPGLRSGSIVVEPEVLSPVADPTARPSSPRTPVAAIVHALRRRGWQSILCEGGPSLAGQLLDAGLVDELCLTVSPMLAALHVPLLGAPLQGGRDPKALAPDAPVGGASGGGAPAGGALSGGAGRPDLPLEPIQLLVDERGGTYARWSVGAVGRGL